MSRNGYKTIFRKKMRYFYNIYVTQLRSGEDPELRNTLKNASYRGGWAAN